MKPPRPSAPVVQDIPSRILKLPLDDGETPEGMRAKTAIRPTLRAATTIAGFDRSVGELDLTTLVGKLAEQANAVQGGNLARSEEMLIAQAHTLDMLFHTLVHRSMTNSQAGYLDASETYMRLALRTQSQCRATLETLSVVKNPPSVAFVRQANIARFQEVNNGARPDAAEFSDDASRARGIVSQPNRLLEQHANERMDGGTTQAAIGTDPAMATVGSLNRAAHGRR